MDSKYIASFSIFICDLIENKDGNRVLYSYEQIEKHLYKECPKMKMRCVTCHGTIFPMDEKIPYKPDK